jgi:hypothetical protein
MFFLILAKVGRPSGRKLNDRNFFSPPPVRQITAKE